jgi:hypothetical protein
MEALWREYEHDGSKPLSEDGQVVAAVEHRMRKPWKRGWAARAPADDGTDAELGQQDAQGESLGYAEAPSSPHYRESHETGGMQPGSYRVTPGRTIQRAPYNEEEDDDDDELVTMEEDDDVAPPPPPLLSAIGSVLMAEARLTQEEEEEQLVVVAWLVRRKWQLVIAAVVALAMIAIIAGLSVGLSAKDPSIPSRTSSPTTQIELKLRSTLPHSLFAVCKTRVLPSRWRTIGLRATTQFAGGAPRMTSPSVLRKESSALRSPHYTSQPAAPHGATRRGGSTLLNMNENGSIAAAELPAVRTRSYLMVMMML